MKLVAAAVLSVAVLWAQPDKSVRIVSAVRHWVNTDSVRIAVEVSGEFEFRSDRLHNPERIYFDIPTSRPEIESHRFFNTDVTSPLVKKIRVAEPNAGVTRIVVDLTSPAEFTASRLRNPNRLVIEMRPQGARTAPPTPTQKPATELVADPAPKPAPPATPATSSPKPFTPPPARTAPPLPSPSPSLGPSPVVYRAETPKTDPIKSVVPRPDPPKVDPPKTELARVEAAKPDLPKPDLTKPDPSKSSLRADIVAPAPVPSRALPTAPTGGLGASADAKAARRTTAGTASLTRALGLKLNRVVIDPGHGGHDQGTAGPHGLLEKELVLDVSLRLGKLIEQEMGAEVLFTRTDDSFVALDRRPQFANERRADLFISVHANSSAYPTVSGIETYTLNFTDSRSALDIAMRENAGSQQPMSELRDMIQKISSYDKAQESREIAAKIQASLQGFESRNFPGEFNRGVKQAPFVVLIGTSMPAILTEIGFVTNPKEEALLKKPEYRQKLAEAIFHGVTKYNESLSHFASAGQPPLGQ